jgi:hypothetical protein
LEPVNHQANLAGPQAVLRLGEKTYILSQPNDKDMQTVQKYLGVFLGKKSKGWLEQLTDSPSWPKLSAAQQEFLLKDALDTERAGKTPMFGTASMMEILSSVDVTRFLAQQ